MAENVFEEVGKGIEVVGKDVAHVVVETVEFPVKAEKVFSTITTDYPAVKTSLLQLVKDGETVDADAVTAVDASGLNVTVDIALWQAIVVAITDLKASVSEVETAYAAINSDVA